MNKKAMSLEMTIGLIIAAIILIILTGLLIKMKFWAEEDVVPTATCRIEVVQAKSKLASKFVKGWPKLAGCKKIGVEIEAKDEKGIIKDLSEYMFKAAVDLGTGNLYSDEEGRYCKRRYHPITFKTKGLKISKIQFNSYLEKNNPVGVNLWIEDYSEDKPIDTSKEYTILFLAYFEDETSKQEGVTLVESNKLLKLKCEELV